VHFERKLRNSRAISGKLGIIGNHQSVRSLERRKQTVNIPWIALIENDETNTEISRGSLTFLNVLSCRGARNVTGMTSISGDLIAKRLVFRNCILDHEVSPLYETLFPESFLKAADESCWWRPDPQESNTPRLFSPLCNRHKGQNVRFGS